MDLKQMLDVLKTVQEGQKDEGVSKLFESFQNLVELQIEYEAQAKQGKKFEREDLLSIFEKMAQSLGDLQKEYGDFCKKMGKSSEEMKAYFGDPKNFTPHAWEELQNMHRAFGTDQAGPTLKKGKKSGKTLKKRASI